MKDENEFGRFLDIFWKNEKEVTKIFELTRSKKKELYLVSTCFCSSLMRYQKLCLGRNESLFQLQSRPTGKHPQFSIVGEKLQFSLNSTQWRCKVSHVAHFAPLFALRKNSQNDTGHDTVDCVVRILTSWVTMCGNLDCARVIEKEVDGLYMNYYNSIIELW